jgi:hypothetical protein
MGQRIRKRKPGSLGHSSSPGFGAWDSEHRVVIEVALFWPHMPQCLFSAQQHGTFSLICLVENDLPIESRYVGMTRDGLKSGTKWHSQRRFLASAHRCTRSSVEIPSTRRSPSASTLRRGLGPPSVLVCAQLAHLPSPPFLCAQSRISSHTTMRVKIDFGSRSRGWAPTADFGPS